MLCLKKLYIHVKLWLVKSSVFLSLYSFPVPPSIQDLIYFLVETLGLSATTILQPVLGKKMTYGLSFQNPVCQETDVAVLHRVGLKSSCSLYVGSLPCSSKKPVGIYYMYNSFSLLNSMHWPVCIHSPDNKTFGSRFTWPKFKKQTII